MVVELAKTAPFGVALKTCGKCALRSDLRRHPRSATAEHRSPRSRAVSRPCTTPQAPERTVNHYYDPTTAQFLTRDPLTVQFFVAVLKSNNRLRTAYITTKPRYLLSYDIASNYCSTSDYSPANTEPITV